VVEVSLDKQDLLLHLPPLSPFINGRRSPFDPFAIGSTRHRSFATRVLPGPAPIDPFVNGEPGPRLPTRRAGLAAPSSVAVKKPFDYGGGHRLVRLSTADHGLNWQLGRVSSQHRLQWPTKSRLITDGRTDLPVSHRRTAWLRMPTWQANADTAEIVVCHSGRFVGPPFCGQPIKHRFLTEAFGRLTRFPSARPRPRLACVELLFVSFRVFRGSNHAASFLRLPRFLAVSAPD